MDVTVKGRRINTSVPVFRVVLVIIGLQGLWCEGRLHQTCVTSRDSQVDVTCPGITDRIFIRRVSYLRFSPFAQCNSRQKPRCSREFDETMEKPAALLRECSGQHHCSLSASDTNQTCISKSRKIKTNRMRMEFNCVPENEFVNLCGSDNRTITQPTHLAVFPKPGDGPLDCSREVSGGRRVVRVLHVELSNVMRTENCSEASFRVTRNIDGLTWADGNFLSGGDTPGNEHGDTEIRLERDCNNSYTPVWLQIIPVPQGLQGVWCEGSLNQTCVTSRDSQVNVTCPRITDRIFIRRVSYLRFSPFAQCNSRQKPRCSREFDETMEKPAVLLRECSGQHHCSPSPGDTKQTCIFKSRKTKTNRMHMEFNCVPENEFVNLCGSDNRTITQPTHLAVFPKPGDGSLDCSCAVSGGRHVIRVVHVELPNVMRTENCSEASLRVTRDIDGLTWADGNFLSGGDRSGNEHGNTEIRLVRDCNNSYTPVWLQIIPQGKNTLTLICKRENHVLPTQYSDAITDTSSTIAEGGTNAGLIAGPFLGGVALGVCLAIIGGIIVRKQRVKQTAEPNSDKDMNGLPRASRSVPSYVEVIAGGGVSVQNGIENVADTYTKGEEAEDGEYQSIRETKETAKRDHRQPGGLIEKRYDTFEAHLKSAPNSVGVYNVCGESDGNGSSGYHVLETVRHPDSNGASDVASYKGSDVTDGTCGTLEENLVGGPGHYHVLDKLRQPEIPPGRAQERACSDSNEGKRPTRAGDYDHIGHIQNTSNELEKL